MKKSQPIYIIFSILLLFANIGCNGSLNLEKFVEKKLKNREGKPNLFTLDGTVFSAETFRSELLFERSHLETKQDFPPPPELRRYLDQYIEESIILDEALSDLDLNNPEVAAYLWPYIRKGLVSYYLDKKSGVFDLNNNYQDIQIPEKELEAFYKEHSSSFKGMSEKESLQRISNSARFVKWKKLYDLKNESKKDILGALRKRHSVQVREGEFNRIGSEK